MIIGFIHSLSNIRRLLVEGHQNRTAVGVKAAGSSAAVANLLDHVAHKVDEVHLRFGCHLTRDHAEAGVDDRFAGHTAGWILRKQRVEYGITDLITDLVRMPLRDGFGGEDVSTHGHR